MKFSVTKSKLVDAFNRIKTIATRGIKPDFNRAGIITIEARKDKIIFSSTNGFINAIFEINSDLDDKLQVQEDGICSVNVVVGSKILKSVGGSDSDSHILKIEATDKALKIKDTSSKNNATARMEILESNHEISIKRPSSSFQYEFETDVFRKCISSVSKYASPSTYDVRFLMSCFHFTPNEIRSICGDNTRFVTYIHELPSPNPDVKDEKGFKFILPVDQSAIILSVIDQTIPYSNTAFRKDEFYLSQKNGIQILLKGIPQVEYALYEQEVSRIGEARAIVDLDTSMFSEAMDLVMSVDAQDYDAQNSFHSCSFNVVEEGKIEFAVDESKYTCNFEATGNYHKISSMKMFHSEYAAMFLYELAKCSNKQCVRFYLIDPQTTILAEPVDLTDAKDERGVPVINKDKSDRLVFFFASAFDDDVSE